MNSQLNINLRRLIYRFAPSQVVTIFKKYYYPYVMKTADATREVDTYIADKLVSEDDIVVDIGANIGTYTTYLSKLVGPKGCVYSLEPVKVTYDILQSNVSRLGLSNVIAINCAASNHNEYIHMKIPKFSIGTPNYYRAEIVTQSKVADDVELVEAETRRLDDIFVDIEENLSFIKCDVEGHEMECLEGALSVIRKSQPAWLIEIDGNIANGKKEQTSSPVFDFLKAEGYSPFWFDGQKLNKSTHNAQSVNYWFLSSSHIKTLMLNGISVAG